jgi:hypothetical protein
MDCSSGWWEKGIPFYVGSAAMLFLSYGAFLMAKCYVLKSGVEALNDILLEEENAKNENLRQNAIIYEQWAVGSPGTNESQKH